MPHLRLRGVTAEQVQEFSKDLNRELAEVLKTSPDNFTVELVSTRFFNDGKAAEGYPFVEVFLFERPAELKERCAQHVTERLRNITGAADIAVVFFPIEKSDYFENGRSFS